jgi:uncharacterized membrane protein YphA (DoxX/SURF4 family)
MSLELTAAGELVLLVARVLVGGVLAFMGLNHFLDTESMTGYARAKGLPAPKVAVLGSGGALLFGGLSVALGVYPAVGAGALATFLLVATPTMHDFWAFDDPEQVQAELTNFLKNVALLGVALGFLALSEVEWAYSAGLGL